MFRVTATKAFAQGTGPWGADYLGILSLFLIATACVALGIAVYILMKSGRGPYISKKKKKPHHAQPHHPDRR